MTTPAELTPAEELAAEELAAAWPRHWPPPTRCQSWGDWTVILPSPLLHEVRVTIVPPQDGLGWEGDLSCGGFHAGHGSATAVIAAIRRNLEELAGALRSLATCYSDAEASEAAARYSAHLAWYLGDEGAPAPPGHDPVPTPAPTTEPAPMNPTTNATATPFNAPGRGYRIRHDSARPRLSAPRLAELSVAIGILDGHGQAVWDIVTDDGHSCRVAVYREVVDSLEVLA